MKFFILFFALLFTASLKAQDAFLPMIVQAEYVSFDGTTQILTGKRVFMQKRIDDSSCIDLKSDHVTVNKNLLTLHAEGQIDISYKKENDSNLREQKLLCEGIMFADHRNKQILITSNPNTQIIFSDEKGTIHSDKAIIDYEEDAHRFSPKKVCLFGNVRMHGEFARKDDSSSPLEQYALADRVEYLPENQLLILQSNPHKRVLFLDKVNQLQMSAPEIVISRNAATKKESIKGKGDVRLTFAGQELEKMYKEFHLK